MQLQRILDRILNRCIMYSILHATIQSYVVQCKGKVKKHKKARTFLLEQCRRNPRLWIIINRLSQKFCFHYFNFKLYSNIKSYSNDKLYSIVRLYSNVKLESKVQLYSHVKLYIFQCLSNNRFLRERGMAHCGPRLPKM